MYKKTVKIINPTGLHARPASDFVAMAKKFTSKIKIKDLSNDEKPANAKSIITLLALGLGKGTDVEIMAEGEDEEKAVESLAALIESGFGE
ncbi:HPr family phosphocarrier protein [Dorea sp. D27]|uniref:HPr family phosphocarrier protein n=1 Tax=Dorea sp. D27 TaxID=658665 RepID=UPI0006732D15|nr:HPr family phosphocarrier protein [Dorea sp. D27]KMZ55164.1 phosphocarrier protein HPr [Dorea sp. D27]